MAGNDDLHPLLKNINKTISKLREDVQKLTGEVKKIPEILEQGFKQVRDAIHENIQAQAELKMMEHMTEVSTVKPQIEAEHEQIEEVEQELDDRLENIGDRYEKKHTELDQKAAERIRDLGSHIFAIEEEQFEDGIEEPFTTQVTPVWQNLQTHNAQVHAERQSHVVEKTDTLAEKIDSFLRRKEELVTQIDDHLLDQNAVPSEIHDPTEIQLPYYVVSYEYDGVSEQLIVPPSEVTHLEEGESWSSVALDEISGTEKLTSPHRDVDPETVTTDRLNQQTILAALDQYSTESRLGPSYSDAAAETLPDGVEIAIEGGDD